MATLYEINDQILSCINAETGEIIDEDKLTELTMQRDEKIENVALWIKNLTSDAAAYKNEKEAFAEREKAAKQKAERLKIWLSKSLEGVKFITSKVAVSFRKSESVECNIEEVPKEFFNQKIEYAPDKNAIKNRLKSGETISGCTLVSKLNIQIK